MTWPLSCPRPWNLSTYRCGSANAGKAAGHTPPERPVSSWARCVRGLRVVACGIGREKGAGDGASLSLGGGVAEHRCQKGLPGELVHRGVGTGNNAGCSRHGMQQRDLPDSLPAPAPPQQTPVLDNVELSCGDQVVRIAL